MEREAFVAKYYVLKLENLQLVKQSICIGADISRLGGSKFDGETFWEETEADDEVINMEEDT